jgi:hypothetical protein
VFSKADEQFSMALNRVSSNSLWTGTSVERVDLWIGAALAKQARGYFEEARELLGKMPKENLSAEQAARIQSILNTRGF